MDYPESILPQATFVTPFPLEVLNHSDYSVTRRIEGKLDDNIDMVGGRARLNPDCLGKIVGMSVNLIGGAFLPEFTSYNQLDRGKESWDGVSEINLADYEGCYEDTGFDYVFYKISLLHNAIYPNVYEFTKKGSYRAYQDFVDNKLNVQFKEGIKVPISVMLSLEHVPTNLNYWHFEMKTELTEEHKQISKEGSWRDLIFTHILMTVLCQDYSEELETTGVISPELYVKQGSLAHCS